MYSIEDIAMLSKIKTFNLIQFFSNFCFDHYCLKVNYKKGKTFEYDSLGLDKQTVPGEFGN